ALLYPLCCRARAPRGLHSFPTRRSSDLSAAARRCLSYHECGHPSLEPTAGSPHTVRKVLGEFTSLAAFGSQGVWFPGSADMSARSEEHTSELQSRGHLVCRLLLEKKKNK